MHLYEVLAESEERPASFSLQYGHARQGYHCSAIRKLKAL